MVIFLFDNLIDLMYNNCRVSVTLHLQSIAERAERELYFFVSLIQLTVISLCCKMLSRLQQDCNTCFKWHIWLIILVVRRRLPVPLGAGLFFNLIENLPL